VCWDLPGGSPLDFPGMSRARGRWGKKSEKRIFSVLGVEDEQRGEGGSKRVLNGTTRSEDLILRREGSPQVVTIEKRWKKRALGWGGAAISETGEGRVTTARRSAELTLGL